MQGWASAYKIKSYCSFEMKMKYRHAKFEALVIRRYDASVTSRVWAKSDPSVCTVKEVLSALPVGTPCVLSYHHTDDFDPGSFEFLHKIVDCLVNEMYSLR